MSKDPETSCKTVLAGTIAKGLLNEVKEGLLKFGSEPHLLGILANDDPSAKVYADWTARTCLEKYATHG
jgi:methylenetetrahydrofolate dehydrogenase (NAD+)